MIFANGYNEYHNILVRNIILHSRSNSLITFEYSHLRL